LKRHLIIEASRHQLGRIEWFGQGTHLLADGKLLIVNGSEINSFDGKAFRELDNPLVDRKLIAREAGSKWIDLEQVRERVRCMNKSEAEKIIQTARGYISQWGFDDQWLDVALVLGWLCAQLVQQVWAWRPHMWISAGTGGGKTMLLEFLEAVGGNLSLARQGQSLTEAGFRQDIGCDSRFCMIDEFERTKARNAIIEYLRSAGRGRSKGRGQSTACPFLHSAYGRRFFHRGRVGPGRGKVAIYRRQSKDGPESKAEASKYNRG
jgi:hypothetical protein